MQVGEEVRAESGLFSGFLGKFIGTAEGGAVSDVSLEVMGAPFNYRLPIEGRQRGLTRASSRNLRA
ncbi:hypothetical protein MPAR168_22200 [Methylorubrum populi]|uniref:hypothetical protein n=1 Tax=Methylorubrum populi TaxID=223967 RepID=UPI002F2F3250